MTTVDHGTSTRRRTTRRSAAASGSPALWMRRTWATVWQLAVPLFIAVHVDQRVGTALGSIPAFWLDGDPTPAGPSVAGVLTLVVAIVTCVVLRQLQADVLLGVIPAVGWLVGGWLGLVVGLALGGIAFAVRRRQGR